MRAVIHWQDGTKTETSATKVNGQWRVGGDTIKATTDLGGVILIYSNGKIYRLKGCRMVFQDYETN